MESAKINISQKELGRRIMLLRKRKRYSQQQLSFIVEISRAALAMIEVGKRKIDAMELVQLSYALEFSIDDVVSEDFNIDEDKTIGLNIQKFKNVLLYILERVGGKPNVGETVLYKLLYFAEFNFYEQYNKPLTGMKYRKLPYGPVPKSFNGIVNEMIEEGDIQMINLDHHGYPQTKYIPCTSPNMRKVRIKERKIIDDVLIKLSDKTAKEITEYSHGDAPWKKAKEKEEIEYEWVNERGAKYRVSKK